MDPKWFIKYDEKVQEFWNDLEKILQKYGNNFDIELTSQFDDIHAVAAYKMIKSQVEYKNMEFDRIEY